MAIFRFMFDVHDQNNFHIEEKRFDKVVSQEEFPKLMETKASSNFWQSIECI